MRPEARINMLLYALLLAVLPKLCSALALSTPELIKKAQSHLEQDQPDSAQWFFQNGPQRVYVELEATPFVWRVGADFSVTAHTGQPARPQRCVVDEHGRVYLDTELGFGLIHTLDVPIAAEAVEAGLWVPEEVYTRDLPTRFGYIRSPQQMLKTLQK